MSKPKLLVADDSATVRKVFELAFEMEEVDAIVAAGGEEALRLAEQRRPDLVIADTDMPDMDGFDLCLALKKGAKTRSIPVYLLTSSLVEFDQARADRCGAEGKLEKPFRSEEMVAKVAAAIRQGPSKKEPAPLQAEDDTFEEFGGMVDELLEQAEREMMEEEMQKLDAAVKKAVGELMAGPKLAKLVEDAVARAVEESVQAAMGRIEQKALAQMEKVTREVTLKVAEDLVKKTISQIRQSGQP